MSRLVAPCAHCPHPYEAHHDYLFAGSMLCWTKPEWIDRKPGYQSCNCPGYKPAMDRVREYHPEKQLR